MPANDPISLSDEGRAQLVETKVTCPFLGAAVAVCRLAVRNDPDNPLASIEDVRALGNTGGGDLGDLLVLFAEGNHAHMRGPEGKLSEAVLLGLFSLELPGSQGSHPGHSGILQGDPRKPASGRFGAVEFKRLLNGAEGGFVTRSAVGVYIAENLMRDPAAKVFGTSVIGLLAHDLLDLVSTVGPAFVSRLCGTKEKSAAAHHQLLEKFTKMLGEDNLVGSAGEWGLLFALLVNKPGARHIDGEPAIAVSDLQSMFMDKRLPDGWETWKKDRIDWVTNTTTLTLSAGREYLRLKKAAAT